MRMVLLFLLFVVLAPFTSHAAAIHDAAKNGDVPGLAAALDAGANVNEADKFATPLYHAVFKQHLGAAELLNRTRCKRQRGMQNRAIRP